MQKLPWVITGATSGLGRATALMLAEAGHPLILPVRNMDKGQALIEPLRTAGAPSVELVHMDLTDFDTVRSGAAAIQQQAPQLGGLINNAGIWGTKPETGKQGFELNCTVNYLAPFLLSGLLLPQLQAGSQIISVSSAAHSMAELPAGEGIFDLPERFRSLNQYGLSKFMQIMFTRYLAERLADRDIRVNTLHPGVVSTNIFRDSPAWLRWLMPLMAISPEKAARNSTGYLALDPAARNLSGVYIVKQAVKEPNKASQDTEGQARLWQQSEAATQFQYAFSS